jgi:hypothetical protein
VLLIADDAGLGDISALRASSGGAAARAPAHLAVGGPPHGLTPNLDSIARKGVRWARQFRIYRAKGASGGRALFHSLARGGGMNRKGHP